MQDGGRCRGDLRPAVEGDGVVTGSQVEGWHATQQRATPVYPSDSGRLRLKAHEFKACLSSFGEVTWQ